MKKIRKGPRSGLAYVITELWQMAVLARLDSMGWTVQDLADRLGCARSTMHDLLKKPKSRSALVPDIHGALGWPAPNESEVVATPPEDANLPAPPHVGGAAKHSPPDEKIGDDKQAGPSADAIEMAYLYDLLPGQIRQKLYQDALFFLKLQGLTAEAAGFGGRHSQESLGVAKSRVTKLPK